MIIKQLSIFLENKSGRLGEVTVSLAKNNIDIRALSIADTSDYGILRLIVDDPDKAETALKTEGLTVTLTEVIAIAVPPQPGGLSVAVKVLSDADIDIEYMYAFVNTQGDAAFVIMRVEDNAKAVKVLTENGVKMMGNQLAVDN